MIVIDTHVHFWRYTDEEFGWIGDDMAAIRKDFLPADYPGFELVAVQARQSIEETDWLLSLQSQNPPGGRGPRLSSTDVHGYSTGDARVCGVVGWLPLQSPEFESLLESRKLVGLRHVLQAEPEAFFAGEAFNHGLAVLADRGLTYDLLVTESQLPQTIRLVDRHPALRFVVDHLAKPDLTAGPTDAWRKDMAELSRRSNVFCKISGGITEANHRWQPEELYPYIDVALEAFGPRRLMYGSNWPVSMATGGTSRWLEAVLHSVAKLSKPEQERIFSGTAVSVYRLEKP